MDLFDIYQQSRIRSMNRLVQLEASAGEQRHRLTRDGLDELQSRIDRLLLINEAMWQLLCETTGLTHEHLLERVRRLDLADGVEDGRRRALAHDCRSCGAKVNAALNRCQFCSADAPQGSLFDAV